MTPSLNRDHPDEPIEILLVEDNPGDVRLIQEAFKTTGRETILSVVTSGADAIAFLTQEAIADAIPNLVLLDLNLPGRNGFEVLRTLRDDPHLQYLPVTVLSSSRAEEDIAKSYETGANAYLTKPDSMAEFFSLAESIEQFWLERARLPPAPA